VLKRFGYCFKHFDLFLNSVQFWEKEIHLNDTLQFLNQQIRTIQNHMESLEKGEKDLQLCRMLRNLQMMRTLTVQHIPHSKSPRGSFDFSAQLPPNSTVPEEVRTATSWEKLNSPLLNATTSFEELAASIGDASTEFISEEDFFQEFVSENTPFPQQTEGKKRPRSREPEGPEVFRTLEDCLGLPPAEFLDGFVLIDDVMYWTKRVKTD